MKKHVPKIYNREKDVYTAAKERVKFIFERYPDEKIIVNFSGGKDSSIIMYLCIEYAREHNRKFNVLFVDQELEHDLTIQHMELIREKYKEFYLKFWWLCPQMFRKITFLDDRVIFVWGPDRMRDFPEGAYIHDMTNRAPKKNGLVKKIIKSFLAKERLTDCAFILGLRANESVRRYTAATMGDAIEGIAWSRQGEGTRNVKFYPIYDWYDKDIWKYIGDNKLDYNRIYDMYYLKNLPISEMRSSSILNVHALKKLNVIKEMDLDYYNRLHKRIGDIDIMVNKEVAEAMVKKAKLSKSRKLGKTKTLELWERLKKEL
ncbi:phosphoadenosine phosphosulfate reductase family protein [Draconibacterium orientale]|uniref:phosphoadenosine phosphosulfate reductase domain-containing protein n=1 Tax=Draconibacterium orientale TaxID=1168034 RepID=UPI0029C0712F|nr:phosphoadenosine phosphosulfate reductase family protein [Draconibacterium orientale]